ALQQSPLWLSATRQLGGDAVMEDVGGRRVLVLRRSLPVIGDLALLSRADLGLLPGAAATLRRDLGVRHLVVNAETTSDAMALAAAGYHKIFAPRVVAELTLLPSVDAMAARLTPKWRNRLRRGQAQGLTIRRHLMPPDERYWLFKAEAAQSLRKWYQPLPAEVIAAMAAGHPGAAQVFTAYHLGQRVAAMLFLRHGRNATYQIGWSNNEGRRLPAGPALMWRAMVELQAMGTEHMDLGAADRRLAPGLAHFKRGTGADFRALGGSWLDTSWAIRKGKRARRRAAAQLAEDICPVAQPLMANP
ncbi:MAG: GNAT family N-acetyltransferase, partial [Roseicyclus sp.]|nr:GNAT family N-acetyltransferase [Roseicyclus sp.]